MEKKSVNEVHKLLGLSKSAIRDYIARYRERQHIYTDEEIEKKVDPNYKRPRERYVITRLCGMLIKILVDANRQWTLQQLKNKLQTSFNYNVSITALHDYLRDELGYTHKVVQRVANECDARSRAIFWNEFYLHCMIISS